MKTPITSLMRVLDEAPEDWGHRRRLVERLLEDGHQGEALQILAEAPSVPEDENEELFFCEQLLEEAPADVLPFLYRTLMRNPSSASAEALREKATRLMAVKPDLMLARESSGYAHAAPPSQANPRLITPQLTRTAPVVTPPPAASLSSTQIANRVAQSQRLAKKKNRTLAVLIAGVIHALIILLCIFWILKPSALSEPMVILGVPPAEEIQDQVTKRTIAQVLPQRPSSSSASRMPVIAANALSSISVPQIEIEEVTEDIVGAGDSFGMGSGWGDGSGGSGGGAVRFFGEEKKARRVCFIVDYSSSMASGTVDGTRHAMLKRELTESIDRLDPAMRYCVIFFSGVGWLQDESPRDRAVMGRAGLDDPELAITWYDASKKNKKETIGRINAMPLASNSGAGAGTLWMTGFQPAMKIQPMADLVYLLTDGVCSDYLRGINATSEQEMIQAFATNVDAWNTFRDELLALVPPGVSLNTVSMERPGTVAARLAELAQKTGGDFSIVWEGKTYTGKRALKFGDKEYDTK